MMIHSPAIVNSVATPAIFDLVFGFARGGLPAILLGLLPAVSAAIGSVAASVAS